MCYEDASKEVQETISAWMFQTLFISGAHRDGADEASAKKWGDSVLSMVDGMTCQDAVLYVLEQCAAHIKEGMKKENT